MNFSQTESEFVSDSRALCCYLWQQAWSVDLVRHFQILTTAPVGASLALLIFFTLCSKRLAMEYKLGLHWSKLSRQAYKSILDSSHYLSPPFSYDEFPESCG